MKTFNSQLSINCSLVSKRGSPETWTDSSLLRARYFLLNIIYLFSILVTFYIESYASALWIVLL